MESKSACRTGHTYRIFSSREPWAAESAMRRTRLTCPASAPQSSLDPVMHEASRQLQYRSGFLPRLPFGQTRLQPASVSQTAVQRPGSVRSSSTIEVQIERAT